MNPKSLTLLLPLLLLSANAVLADKLVDFESDALGAKPLGWTFNGDSSNLIIEATIPSGDYPGGQAIRTDNSGASYAALRYAGPTIVSLQADFLWDWATDGTPTLAVYGWDDDDADGFQAAERTVGFGMDNDGQFELSNEFGEIPGTSNFSDDNWYRLTMTWNDPDESGNRLVTLSVFDLTNSFDFGVVESVNMTPEEFGVAPSEWEGIAIRMTRGTIDNIRIIAESGSFVYVDASPANTMLNSDPTNFPEGVPLEAGVNYIDDGTGGSGMDNLWTYRTDASFATFENGSGFESDNLNIAEDAEVTDDLITTIDLPAAGTYALVAVFSRKNNRDIAVRAGSTPGPGDIFDGTLNLNADQNADSLEIEFDQSFTNSRGNNSGVAYLGHVTTTSDNESVRIFINGLASTAAVDDERTQYDGVGYLLISGSPALSIAIVDFTYSATDGASQATITGTPGARYKLVEADSLDFQDPDIDPLTLTGVTVGTQDGNEFIADANGDATVQFTLATGKAASFIRAVQLP